MYRSSFLIAAALALSSAAAASPAGKVRDAPEVTERVVSGLYLIQGGFDVSAPPGTVWSVLTDYDRIGGFVSSLRKSHVKERRAEGLVVEQAALGKVLGVSKEIHLTLLVHETPVQEILFRDLSRMDFDVYAGSWTVTPLPRGARVVYRLRVRPRPGVPRFLVEEAFKQGASELLGQVRAEIERRGGP